jgi:hypothetical protein
MAADPDRDPDTFALLSSRVDPDDRADVEAWLGAVKTRRRRERAAPVETLPARRTA